jgi:geranylgeranyl diphosphate synthase, type I
MARVGEQQESRSLGDVMGSFHQTFDSLLCSWGLADDEAGLDASWTSARQHLYEYTLRPGKRVRPSLVALGYLLTRAKDASPQLPDSVVQFSVGIELLHTFMLVHDDVADRAKTRRGGKSLHELLGEGRLGEDLAIVAGDHLYARAIEAMLASPSARAAEVTRYMMAICRHTAVGQHLDLSVSALPLPDVTLFQTLKIAQLKTARYGFVAPLVCGAMLGGARDGLLDILERFGRMAGLAYQLKDDLFGLFGDESATKKPTGSDFFESKKTFPLLAAWTRADEVGKRRLEMLWSKHENRTDGDLQIAREEIRRYGGEVATERVIERMTRNALRSLSPLRDHPALDLLDSMLSVLSHRAG